MLDKHAAMWGALFDFDIVANNLHGRGGGELPTATLHTPIANAASPFVMQTADHTAPHTHAHIFIVAHSHFHALSLSLVLTLGPTGQRYQFATFASPGYRRRRRTRRCAF